ncbi:Excinuclease ABC C subunit domain protein (plasmid) [Gloeocapsa sp. PCC 7428]|uniref:ATP-binding protein n=1 Tax=Gloeocapsa sp. PCC 7428 TaxID=1173026 RepID=UPI0002A5D377|nr:DUF87 domain-containing protein [Gloeocapsa sp. PCC 7428]AFZ33332.1 Excinuclease ABC C subunit domain protein [Gloeocapsa sp. PCC 7428]
MFQKKAKPLPEPVLKVVRNAPTVAPVATSPGILLGENTRWNPELLPNAHIAIIGASGSGKTQTLKAIAYELHRLYSNTQIILIDFHGDQEVEGEVVYPLHMASPYGINPLVVNPDPEGGGPNLQAIAVAATLKKVLVLGPNQEGKLLEIFKTCYQKRGIVQEKPDTWLLEPPNFDDLEEEINRRSIETVTDEETQASAQTINPLDLPQSTPPKAPGIYFVLQGEKVIYVGASMNLLNRLTGNHHVLKKVSKSAVVHWYQQDSEWEQLLKLETALIKRFEPNFNELELKPKCKESEKLRLKLAATFQYGIFSRPQPKFEERLIRVDLSKLPPALQSIAAESLARQLMDKHRLMGEIAGKIPRTFLFIDEAKEMPKNSGNSCDRITADGRKYGLALVAASQSERHLSADLIGNSATKIVLPVDQTEVRSVAKKFRFAEERVARLSPLQALCRFGKDASQVDIMPYFQRLESEE